MPRDVMGRAALEENTKSLSLTLSDIHWFTPDVSQFATASVTITVIAAHLTLRYIVFVFGQLL